jgi:hypothetical protein
LPGVIGFGKYPPSHQFKNHYFCRSTFIVEKTNFVDQIRIFCRSGHGGAGSRHFARTKFNPLAGPDGGNGGRGGHIILKGNRNLWTLASSAVISKTY